MHKQLLMDDEFFWPFLDYISNLPSDRSYEQIAEDLDLEVSRVEGYIEALKTLGPYIHTYENINKKFLKPVEWNELVQMEFTIPEWLKFQAHFPYLDKAEGKPFHQDVFQKLAQCEMKYERLDLFKLEKINSDLNESILQNKLIEISHNLDKLIVSPRRLLVLDGEINLIAENTADKSLITFYAKDIDDFKPVDKEYENIYAEHEVEDFISSLRLISESCIRLILKVYNAEEFHLKVNNHFFEKPCLFSNLKGESIWAATVEPNEDLYKWLMDIGSNVEILDPIEFKKDFLLYCENHLKKIA